MGRPSNTEQRKQEIVTALLHVMANVGYEKASIQSIAKQAGLAPGLIHYHFKTKQDILVAAIHWIAASAEQRLQAMLNDARDPWEKLKAFVNARLATGETQMPLREIFKRPIILILSFVFNINAFPVCQSHAIFSDVLFFRI